MSGANIISKYTFPKAPNTNEYLCLSSSDSDSWVVSGKDLICKKAGTWQLTSQYQLVSINSVESGLNARLTGWFNLNGKDVKNSAASSYASEVDGTAVLTIAWAYTFKKGDKVRFGIRSDSNTLPPTLNIVAKGFCTGAKVYAPSLIVTAIKA